MASNRELKLIIQSLPRKELLIKDIDPNENNSLHRKNVVRITYFPGQSFLLASDACFPRVYLGLNEHCSPPSGQRGSNFNSDFQTAVKLGMVFEVVAPDPRMAGQPFHRGSRLIRRLAASWEPFSFCYVPILRAVQRWLVFQKSDDDDDDLTRSNNIYFLFISSGK